MDINLIQSSVSILIILVMLTFFILGSVAFIYFIMLANKGIKILEIKKDKI